MCNIYMKDLDCYCNLNIHVYVPTTIRTGMRIGNIKYGLIISC